MSAIPNYYPPVTLKLGDIVRLPAFLCLQFGIQNEPYLIIGINQGNETFPCAFLTTNGEVLYFAEHEVILEQKT